MGSYLYMAEGMGFEPMHGFTRDGLANRCRNHLANPPCNMCIIPYDYK